jgi:2-desacetyl-2-hydroxyethyl bacteriochlorophyllide A dehydrogenase
MRGAVMTEPGRIEVRRTLPVPEIGPGDVLVNVTEVALCKSEVDRFTGAMLLPEPLAFGHEVVGRVHKIGDAVTTLAVGDRVVPYVEPMHGCADLVAVPADRCVKVPDDEPAAVLTELLACAVGAIRQADPRSGDSVVLMGGTGALGELLRAVLNVRFPELSHVFVLGRNPDALARAAADGRTVALDVSDGIADARRAILEATGGQGADVVLEVSGAAPMLLEAPTLARTGGTLGIVGYPAEPTPFDFHRVCGGGQAVRIAHWRDPGVKHAFMEEAAELIGSGALSIADLITRRFPLADVADAFEYATSRNAIKVVVEL